MKGGEGGEEAKEEEQQGQIRTERKRAKSLFKMLKSEMSHTLCPPFVPLGPPLVQHASNGLSQAARENSRGLSMVTSNKQQGELQGLHPRLDGWTDGPRASHIRRRLEEDEKKKQKTENKPSKKGHAQSTPWLEERGTAS